ncbi:MAG: heavy metal translocating P-type ATPase [Patescibacteria group bacterium]|nr:heavy metal translocating P-type ATPase [Patescibacteria group bacterium]
MLQKLVMDCCEPQNNPHENHASHDMNHDSGHDHHADHTSHGMSHGSAGGYLRRFWLVTFLLIPLALTNEFVAGLTGLPELALAKWIQFGFATAIFAFSLIFFQHAWHEIKARQYGMMTLVSTAVGAGYLFSVASTFIPTLEAEFYFEISTLVWVLLFGHYLEAKSSGAAGDALQEVAKLLPRTAHLLKDGEVHEVDVASLKEGDTVFVKPGEKAPADGTVKEGEAIADESLISGESKPVSKKVGDKVVAGSIVLDGSLTILLSRVGENSTIGQIQKLISEARQTKPRSQRIADKASAILTFTAGTVALLTLLVWTLILNEPFVFAITLSITVLVIACPHALGLAIPTVTTISTSLAVKNGIFIKNMAKIETIKKADYVVLDKTGTLTEGKFGVSSVVPIAPVGEGDVLRIAASLGVHSSHVIDRPIVERAKRSDTALAKVDGFKNVPGRGIMGEIGGKKYFLGNKAFVDEQSRFTKETLERYQKLLQGGATVILLADTGGVLGMIALVDQIRAESQEAIDQIHAMGLKVVMLTGDNEQIAKSVAGQLNIDSYFAEVLPEDKYKHIKSLQEQGFTVLMVGDGINDAPALAQADAGIAIGAGTDVAVEAGDVILTRSNPLDIARLLKLSKKVYQKMIQNLVWALGYNVVAIPAAAGVFAAWGFFLRPELGALVMSLSTVVVVINALTLKRINL